MSDSDGKRARRFHALQVTAILLLLAVLVGTLVLESLRLSDGIRRETAVQMTLPRKKTAQGYVFRDEAVISSVNNGPVRYAVRDGATVSVGDLLADVYQDDTNTGKRALGADLMAQIEALQALDDAADTAWQPAYLSSYFSLMRGLSKGELLRTEDATVALREAFSVRDAKREDPAARAARIAELQASFDELIKYASGERRAATHAGIFCRVTDGYEDFLTAAAAATVTPESLSVMLAEGKKEPSAIGKIILPGDWYLALSVGRGEAACFEAGSVYPLSFTRTDRNENMTLVRIVPAEERDEVLLVFRADAGTAPPADGCRRQEIELSFAPVSGIRVPHSALQEENGQTYVFVDASGHAARRSVEVILSRDGYCLCAVREEEGWLREGETLLVTPRRLYEGKALH